MNQPRRPVIETCRCNYCEQVKPCIAGVRVGRCCGECGAAIAEIRGVPRAIPAPPAPLDDAGIDRFDPTAAGT